MLLWNPITKIWLNVSTFESWTILLILHFRITSISLMMLLEISTICHQLSSFGNMRRSLWSMAIVILSLNLIINLQIRMWWQTMCHHICRILSFVWLLTTAIRFEVLWAMNILMSCTHIYLILLKTHFAQVSCTSLWSILLSTWLNSSTLWYHTTILAAHHKIIVDWSPKID